MRRQESGADNSSLVYGEKTKYRNAYLYTDRDLLNEFLEETEKLDGKSAFLDDLLSVDGEMEDFAKIFPLANSKQKAVLIGRFNEQMDNLLAANGGEIQNLPKNIVASLIGFLYFLRRQQIPPSVISEFRCLDDLPDKISVGYKTKDHKVPLKIADCKVERNFFNDQQPGVVEVSGRSHPDSSEKIEDNTPLQQEPSQGFFDWVSETVNKTFGSYNLPGFRNATKRFFDVSTRSLRQAGDMVKNNFRLISQKFLDKSNVDKNAKEEPSANNAELHIANNVDDCNLDKLDKKDFARLFSSKSFKSIKQAEGGDCYALAALYKVLEDMLKNPENFFRQKGVFEIRKIRPNLIGLDSFPNENVYYVYLNKRFLDQSTGQYIFKRERVSVTVDRLEFVEKAGLVHADNPLGVKILISAMHSVLSRERSEKKPRVPGQFPVLYPQQNRTYRKDLDNEFLWSGGLPRRSVEMLVGNVEKVVFKIRKDDGGRQLTTGQLNAKLIDIINDFKKINYGYLGKLFLFAGTIEKEKFVEVASDLSKEDFKRLKDKKLIPSHAYVIEDIEINRSLNIESITIINPHDTSVRIKLTAEDFYKFFDFCEILFKKPQIASEIVSRSSPPVELPRAA